MASFTPSARGKAKTKSALRNFAHDGGHAFAEPPAKTKPKSRRESLTDMLQNTVEKAAAVAKDVHTAVKKSTRASVTTMSKAIKDKRASIKFLKTGVPSELSSLVRDLEVDINGTVLKPGIARVFLSDTSVSANFTFDQYTLMGELNLQMRSVLGLPYDGVCGIVQYGFGNYLPVDEDVRVVDVMADWPSAAELDGSCRLAYIQEYYLPSGPFDDLARTAESSSKGLGSHRLKYIETCHRLSRGYYSLSVKRSIKVCAMQVIAMRIRNPNAVVDVDAIISPAIMERFGRDAVNADVAEEVDILSPLGNTAISLELQVIEMVEDACPFFGASMFPVNLLTQDEKQVGPRSEPKPVLCAVSNDGIYLLTGWNLSFSEYYAYSNIVQWTVAPNPNLFAFVTAGEIKFLLYDYPEAIQQRVQDSITALMAFHNGDTQVMGKRDEEEIHHLKFVQIEEEGDVDPSTVIEPELVSSSGVDFFLGKGSSAEHSNPLSRRRDKRGSMAIASGISAGVEVDEASKEQARSLTTVSFGGAPPPPPPPPPPADAPPPPAGLGAKPLMKSKQANLSKNPPLSAKERRMSAIRALHARKEANKKKSEKGEI